MIAFIIDVLTHTHYPNANFAILGAIVGGLGLAKGLIGSKQTQQQQQRQYTEFRPEDIAAMDQGRSRLETGRSNLLDQLKASQQALQSGMVMPGTSFQFGTSPDALTKAMASQGSQAMSQQAAAQRAAIASQFRGQPGVSGVLQAQANMQSRLQQNPLLFQAFQQQQGRELAQAQQQQAQIQAANQALLQREQALSGLAGTGLSADQQLFDQLMRYASARGVQVGSGSSSGRSGGLF